MAFPPSPEVNTAGLAQLRRGVRGGGGKDGRGGNLPLVFKGSLFEERIVPTAMLMSQQ